MNPASRLTDTFTRIAATRMAGVPLCNPALAVETVGMSPWQGQWLGVLITPWAINLVLLPGEDVEGGGVFRPIGVGASQTWAFPSGDYEFLGNREDGLGPYQTCSLASPAFEFESQHAARCFAEAALTELLRAPPPPAPVDTAPGGAPSLDRRAFLRAVVPGARA